MKQLLRSISCMLIMLLIITGCGQNSGQSKVTKGCYVEKVIEWGNEGEPLAIGKTSEGKIISSHYDEGQESAIIYSLKEDGTWEEINKIPLVYPEDKSIVASSISEDCIMFLQISEEDGSSQISEFRSDGTQKVIELKEEGKPYILSLNEWYTFSKAENGDYIICEGWGKNLNSFDGKNGEVKYHFINDCLSYALAGEKLVCNGWQERSISTFNFDNGEMLESFEYPYEGQANCVDLTDEGIYLFNNVKGISFKNKDSEEWNSIVNADRNQLADASNGIIQAYVINDKSFFVQFSDGSMMTYTYDPEAEDIISAEINVFMAWDVALLQKAISIYQKEHKDVKINIVNYADQERPLDTLNAEILSGEGPDLLLMDGMPIQTYIDKGVLVDLSDLAEEFYQKEGCYKNVIDAYKQGESVWAIPMRFQVPMLWGKNEIMNEAHSLEELAQYRKAHPNEALLKKNMAELGYQLYQYSEPFVSEGGNYSRERVTQYINLLEEVGVQEGEITDQIYGERLEVEPSKYLELLDFANSESNLFIVAPRNVGDIARADSVLDARKQEDLGVKALEINGKVPFIANGVLTINKNSKHQDIVKDIIRIALDEEVQGEVNYLGIPITETALNTQEQFLKYFEDEIKDDKGRSVAVDNDITRVYDACKAIWKEAGLCCNSSTSMPYDALSMITSIYKDHLDVEQVLDEYDKSREVKEKE